MGDENEREQPSLELPKLGLRRRRKKPEAATPPPPPPAPDPEPIPEPIPEPTPEPAPVSGGLRSVSVDRTEPNPPQPEAPTLVEIPVDPEPEPVPEPAPEPKRRRERRPIRVRPQKPGGMAAAVVVGLVVGLGIVGLTWASLQGCDQIQGTTSCGKAGYPLLIAILVVMVFVGALLLRLARVAEAGATSFLAVGLASVLALLLLVDDLTDRSMVVVIPVLSAICYAAAHALTRAFGDAAR